jgi:hypothetical protein
MTLDLCAFEGNSASGGSASGIPALTGAAGSGGAIFNDGALTAERTTLSGNTATGGNGGMGSCGEPAGGAGGAGGGANGGATFVSNTPAGNDSFTEPKLGPLANNGVPTLAMALLPGSPAIDAGNTSLAPATDQSGFPRPAGPAADIGAFEYGAMLPLLTINRSPGAGMDLLIFGNADRSCRLLSSMNLLNWQTLATNQLGAAGTASFHDNSSANETQRFHRVVMP